MAVAAADNFLRRFVNARNLSEPTEEVNVNIKGGISVKSFFILVTFMLLASGCHSYSLEDAEKNGDLITGLVEMNHEKIDEFMNDVKNNNESEIRITSFTIEGDPVLNDLSYKNGIIEYIYDNSRDKHGGKNKRSYTTKCEGIEKREIIGIDEQDKDEYILTGCNEIIGIHDPDMKEIYLLNLYK